MGIGCKDKTILLTNFISKSNTLYNNKYDYSKFKWDKSTTNSIIICPEHGEFFKSPSNHLKGQECPTCSKIKSFNLKLDKAKTKFFLLANEIHNNKYDYSKSEYKSSRDKIIILCPEHGEFIQTPNRHTIGKTGCPKCANISKAINNTMSIKEFINKANEIHNNKYDYSKSIYIKGNEPITIICPEHGEFIIKYAKKHIDINRRQECPKCNGVISKGELYIMNYLNSNNIEYKYNSILDSNNSIINNKPYDFIIDKLKIIIEYDGEQHFKCKFKMTEEDLLQRKMIDNVKDIVAKSYGYNIIRIKYNDNILDCLNKYFSSTTIETTYE